MNKKYLFFTLILSNFCNHYSFTMDNQPPSKIIDEKIKGDNRTKYLEKQEDYNKLYHAMKSSDLNTIRNLFKEKWLDPNLVYYVGKESSGECLLSYAVSTNNVNLVKFLIDIGADVDLKASYVTPLEMSLREDIKPEIFQLLVDELAKKDKLTDIDPNTGETILHKIFYTEDRSSPNNRDAKIKIILNALIKKLGNGSKFNNFISIKDKKEWAVRYRTYVYLWIL